jgi:hypothetical protein
MSAIGEIKFVNAIDKKYQIVDSNHNKPTYQLVKGVKSIDYKHLPSSQNTSTTSTEYLVQPQLNQFVSNYLTEEVTVNFIFSFSNATAGAIFPFPQGSLTSTFMPLTQATNTLTVSLNGTPFKMSNPDIASLLYSFNKTPELNGRDLVSASQLDSFTDNLPFSGTANSAYAHQIGSMQSTFNNYFNSTYGIDSRFGSVQWAIDNTAIGAGATNIQRIVSMTIREPLFCGVTALCAEDETNWTGLTSLQITRTFVGNVVARMLRYVNQGALTYAPVQWTFGPAIPTLYYKLTTLPDDTIIPKSTWYQGFSYDNMSVQQGSVCNALPATGAPSSVTIQGQTINLSHVPRAIYICMMAPGNTRTLTSSDAPGFQITGIQVSYGGTASQFASLSNAYEIYKELSGAEGFVKTFTESGYTQYLNDANLYVNMGLYGTVLRIDGSKLSLDWSKYSIGCAFNTSLSVTVTGINLSSANVTPSLYVIPVNDIVYNIADNLCMASKGLLTEAQVQEVRRQNTVVLVNSNLIGGNIFKNMWDGIKSGANYVWDHKNQIVDGVKDGVNTALKVAPLLGLGKKQHKLKGRGLYEEDEDEEYLGGSVMTHAEMKHRLKFL